MMLWALIALLCVVVIAILLPPLWRAPKAVAGRVGYDVAVYKDQLAEIDRDLARGVLAADQAEAARTEIQRRLLAAAQTDAAEPVLKTAKSLRGLAVTLAVGLPLCGLVLYLALGAPGLPDQPYAGRKAEIEEAMQKSREIARMVGKLAERLKQNPTDPQGWMLLGRSYRAMEHYADAADAFGRAFDLSGEAEAAADQAEMLIMAAEGDEVSEAAVAALERALAKDPKSVKARYYRASAKLARGDALGAVQDLTDLAADAPADAPWLADVKSRIDEIAKQSGIDAAKIKPRVKPQGALDPEALIGDAARDQLIDEHTKPLLAKLKDNPKDLEAWIRLGRTYIVAEEPTKAKDAFAKAAGLAPHDKSVLTEYASAILSAQTDKDKVGSELAAVLKRILRLDPEDTNALWYLGLFEKQSGRPEQAAGYWKPLLARAPQGSSAHTRLKQELDALGEAGK